MLKRALPVFIGVLLVITTSGTFATGALLDFDIQEISVELENTTEVISSPQTPDGWGEDIPLTDASAGPRDSSIAIDSQGNVHAVWADYPDYYYNIYYTKLDNEGNKLINDIKITNTSYGVSFPSLAIDSQDNVHIVAQYRHAGGTDIVYTKLDSNGNTLTPLKLITSLEGREFAPTIRIDSEDNIHLTGMHELGGVNEVFYAKYDNSGVIIINEIILTTILLGWNGQFPSIDVDSQLNCYITWDNNPTGGGYNVYYSKIDNTGTILIDQAQLSTSDTDQFPYVVIDASDTVYIAWGAFVEGSGSTWEIFLTKIDSGGVVVFNKKQITHLDSMSNHPTIAIDSLNRISVFWYNNTFSTYHKVVDENGDSITQSVCLTCDEGHALFESAAIDRSDNVHFTFWKHFNDFTDYEIFYKRSYNLYDLEKIYGDVTEKSSNNPINGASVLLIQNGLILDGDSTDSSGYYEFPDLEPATYDIRVSKNGYNDSYISGIVIESGHQVEQNIELVAPISVDLVADSIDVLQSVETEKLIVNKPTVVRVHAHVDGIEHLDDAVVQLRVQGPSIDFTLNKNVTVKHSYSVAEAERGDEAFEFYYTPSTSGTYTFTATVTSTTITDANSSNNSIAVSGKDFSVVQDPSILVVPIKVGSVTPGVDILNSSWKFTRKTFPFTSGFTADIQSQPAVENNGIIKNGKDEAETLSRLQIFKVLHAGSYKFVAGILPAGSVSTGDTGFSSPFYSVTASVANSTNVHSLESAFAHELFHVATNTFGEEYSNHPPLGLAIDKNEKPFDAYLRIPTRSWYDLMSGSVKTGTYRRSFRGAAPQPYEQGYEMSWIRREDYEDLVPHFESFAPMARTMSEGEYYLINAVTESGNDASLEPIIKINGSYQASIDDPQGEYQLKIKDYNGDLLDSYRFTPYPFTGSYSEEIGMISFSIPYNPEIARFIIEKDGVPLAEKIASVSAPSLNISYPNGGESLSGLQTITWDAEDTDFDQLQFAVLFSTDNGLTYTPLTVGLESTSYEWNTDLTPGCDGTCKIKVLAMDGFYTVEDESDGTFSSQKHSPVVTITSPGDQDRFVISQAVVFEGNGYDAEDGTLSGSQLIWSSDIDGIIGTGNYLSVQTLSSGVHTITLAGEDSDLNYSQDQIQININTDTDNDGMPDDWEIQYGLNILFDDSIIDPDQDGANNIDEYFSGTDPVVWQPVLKPFRDIRVDEKKTVSITPRVSNPDAIPLDYLIDSQLFTWNGTSFYWNTNEHSSGEYYFTITVTDGVTSDFQQAQVIVNNTCRIFNKKTWLWDCEEENIHNNLPVAK